MTPESETPPSTSAPATDLWVTPLIPNAAGTPLGLSLAGNTALPVVGRPIQIG